ncbi:MAG: CocE/NonD family hydrolase, partial [Myxococcota bacterium]
MGTLPPFWPDFVDHGPEDPFWEGQANHDTADLASMPPVDMVTGWWDCFLPDQLDDFERLRAAGVTTRLLVGRGAHSDFGTGRQATISALEWMRHHLLGEPIADAPSVRIYVQQADVWLDLPDWPPPTEEQSLYLAAGR